MRASRHLASELIEAAALRSQVDPNSNPHPHPYPSSNPNLNPNPNQAMLVEAAKLRTQLEATKVRAGPHPN